MKGCTICNLTYPNVPDDVRDVCTNCGNELQFVELIAIRGTNRVIQSKKRITGKDLLHQRKIDEMKLQFGEGRCLTCGRVISKTADFCTENCETTFDKAFDEQVEKVKMIMQTLENIEKEPDESFVG